MELQDDDSAFLTALDAVEALHSSSLPHPPPISKIPISPKRPKLAPEGDYLAALRGTHSKTWQANMGDASLPSSRHGRSTFVNPRPPSTFAAPASWVQEPDGGNAVPSRDCPCGAGACKVLTANTEKNAGRQFYLCPLRKEEGQCPFFEWCDASSHRMNPGLAQNDGHGHKPPEIACPCGAGNCAILTAKTEKNMGRLFYKCPLNQDEGQCSFFEWCDAASNRMNPGVAQTDGHGYKPPEISCPCGAGHCAILTAKTEKNMGRQFYKCPLKQGEGACGFFKWCDETTPNPKGPVFLSRAGEMPSSQSSANTIQCITCGMHGHWSKDCPNKRPVKFTSNSPPRAPTGFGTKGAGKGGRGAMVGSYKYGSDEHYSLNAGSIGANSFGAGRNTKSGSCFTCGEEGHWSPNCPNAANKGFGLNRDTGSGSCYKCGAQGHWSNNCPNAESTRPSSFGGQFQGSRGGNMLAGKTGGTKSCYKCGGLGHWANECRG